jgi:hypothetical protein
MFEIDRQRNRTPAFSSGVVAPQILSERAGASAEVQQDQMNWGPDGEGSVALLAELAPGQKGSEPALEEAVARNAVRQLLSKFFAIVWLLSATGRIPVRWLRFSAINF